MALKLREIIIGKGADAAWEMINILAKDGKAHLILRWKRNEDDSEEV